MQSRGGIDSTIQRSLTPQHALQLPERRFDVAMSETQLDHAVHVGKYLAALLDQQRDTPEATCALKHADQVDDSLERYSEVVLSR